MHPTLSADDFDRILWTWTRYPMGDTKTIVKQFGSRVRSLKNKQRPCWFCSTKKGIEYRSWCPNKDGEYGDNECV